MNKRAEYKSHREFAGNYIYLLITLFIGALTMVSCEKEPAAAFEFIETSPTIGVPAAATQLKIKFKSAKDWTATYTQVPSTRWFSADKMSGDGGNQLSTVRFTLNSNNDTQSSRMAIFTVSYGDGKKARFNITQWQATTGVETVPPTPTFTDMALSEMVTLTQTITSPDPTEGAIFTVKVSSSDEPTIRALLPSGEDADWIEAASVATKSMTGYDITVTVGPNNTGVSRTATLHLGCWRDGVWTGHTSLDDNGKICEMTQLKIAPTIRNVTPASIEFEATDTDATVAQAVTFDSSLAGWTATVSSGSEWCEIVGASLGIAGSGTISAKVTSENTSETPRTATITITPAGGTPTEITVTQLKAIPTIAVTDPGTKRIEFEANGIQSKDITFNSLLANWTAEVDSGGATWCEIESGGASGDTGSGKTIIVKTRSDNAANTPRETKIIITPIGGTPTEITVTQAKRPEIAQISPGNLIEFVAKGAGTQTITFDSLSADWTAVVDAGGGAWCAIEGNDSGVKGVGKTITVKAKSDNGIETPRTATITITPTGGTPKTVTVTQKGAIKFKINGTVAAGNTISIEVVGEITVLRIQLANSTAEAYTAALSNDDSFSTYDGFDSFTDIAKTVSNEEITISIATPRQVNMTPYLRGNKLIAKKTVRFSCQDQYIDVVFTQEITWGVMVNIGTVSAPEWLIVADRNCQEGTENNAALANDNSDGAYGDRYNFGDSESVCGKFKDNNKKGEGKWRRPTRTEFEALVTGGGGVSKFVIKDKVWKLADGRTDKSDVKVTFPLNLDGKRNNKVEVGGGYWTITKDTETNNLYYMLSLDDESKVFSYDKEARLSVRCVKSVD